VSPERLDRYLVDRGIVASRQKAQELIGNKVVSVNDRVVTKPSHQVRDTDAVVVSDASVDVGRGAAKLRAALDHFGLEPAGMVAVDVGASTGGFTQVLLERGVALVVALDVGHGQLDPSLCKDARVIALEGVNVVELERSWWSHSGLPGSVDLVVCDVSFISLTRVVPVLQELFGPRAHWIVLVKPQFEVGKGKTRQGVVVDEASRESALRTVMESSQKVGRTHLEVVESPVVGKKGNREYLLYAAGE
jgi:23S rRNA (cytidine1920-2'-O)/16S rRNA (cytidine1409-2'-O)-methyltransferase